MTEGWCYGTMSVSALSKGHYCHRGLWEMAPDVLLLILALTACLTEPAHCDEIDGSVAPKTEAQSTRISTTITHTPPVTSGTWSSTFTIIVQEEEVSGDAETRAQITLEQNSTTKLSPNKTTTDNKVKSAPRGSVDHTTVENHVPDVLGQNNSTEDDYEQNETDMWTMFTIAAVSLTLALILVVAAVGLLITCRRRKRNTADPEKDDPYLNDDFGEKVPMPMFEDDMPSVMELEMEDFEKWMIKRESDISMDSKQRHPS